MTPEVTVVEPGGPVPLGSLVLAAADRPGGTVVVVSDPAAGTPAPPAARLAGLLDGRLGIGAVLPGPPRPGRTPGTDGARDTRAPSGSAVAVTAAMVNRSRIDPRSDDPREVIPALVAAARAAGLRVVTDPTWPARVSSRGPAGEYRRPAGLAVLIVTAPVDDEWMRADERAAAELIESVAEACGPVPVTVMTTERTSPSARARWAAAGLTVVEGPEAWAGGPDPYSFSHVVLTAAAARSSARAWVERTQPQAARIVYLPSLAFREVSRIAPVSPADEMAGLDLVRLDVEDAVAHLAGWGHFVWCQWEADAAVLRGWLPGVDVTAIRPAVSVTAAPVPRAQRRGVVVVAAEGHDVIGGHEDAALRALAEVLPAVRDRASGAEWTVVADRPTPMLADACRRAGVEVAASAHLPALVAGARVVLSAPTYGSGQPAVLMGCLEAGTPFVCTPFSAADLGIGSLAGVALCAAAEDLATRTAQLLIDDGRWDAVTAEARRVVEQTYAPGIRASELAAALARAGLAATGPAWPRAGRPAERPEVYRPPVVDIRPAGLAEPGPLPEVVPVDERPRYQLWNERRGPTAEVLDALGQELSGLRHRPEISVLMPVYNTPPDVLRAAVESVRAQIYPRWQLCMANDGSDRAETLRILDGLRSDERVRVVDLPGSSGISGATNAALALATGDFVAFLDHDDELKPHALAQVARWLDADPTIDLLYSDEDKLDPAGELYDPHIKPEWSPDLLTTQNYICHLTVARRSLVEKVGGLRSQFDGSQDYDLLLRLSEQTDRIAHIPEPLYSWRAVPGSAAADAEAKPYAIDAGRRAVADALRRRGYGNRVDTTGRIGFFRARYPIPGNPKVSIIVPTKDGRFLLERCLESVIRKTTYRNYEIVVIDNQSTDGATLSYLETGPWRVIRYPHRFNYARMMNLAARLVDGDALLFLNNDTEIITPEWIEGLLEHAMRPEVGAVGGRLYFGNGEPQHEGIMTGIGGWAHNTNHRGFWGRGEATRNVSAVTGACTMIRPSVFARVGGNDERLRVAYNDVDLCLRIRQAGYQVVYTPHVELYHHESSTRGKFEHEEDGPLFGLRWQVRDNVDPYYSPMFEDFPPFLIRL